MNIEQSTNDHDNVLQLVNKAPFTQISNEILEDTNLSWKAKGLYGYLMSKATIDGWKFRKAHLVEQSKDGKVSFDSAIKELKENGYLEIVSIRKSNGEYSGWRWKIHGSNKSNS